MVVRLVGWVFLVTAVLTASADAVMALGSSAYEGLATKEMWTFLAGRAPDFTSGSALAAGIADRIMELPAWVVLGPLGAALLMLFRRRDRRPSFRRSRLSS